MLVVGPRFVPTRSVEEAVLSLKVPRQGHGTLVVEVGVQMPPGLFVVAPAIQLKYLHDGLVGEVPVVEAANATRDAVRIDFVIIIDENVGQEGLVEVVHISHAGMDLRSFRYPGLPVGLHLGAFNIPTFPLQALHLLGTQKIYEGDLDDDAVALASPKEDSVSDKAPG